MSYTKVRWRRLFDGETPTPGDIYVYDDEDPNHPEQTGKTMPNGAPYSLVMRPVAKGYLGLRIHQCGGIPRQNHIWRPVEIITVEDSAGP